MKSLSKIAAALAAAGSMALASTAMSPAQAQPVDPFAQMDRIFQMQMKQMEMMRRQMDQLFRNFEQNFQTPSVMNMPILVHSSGVLSSGFQDKGDHYELAIKVGDLNNSKINITTENGMLTVEVTENRKIEKQQGNYGKIISYTNSSSVQSFTLPPDADAAKIQAKQDGNTIVILIPKKGSAGTAKTIPVTPAAPQKSATPENNGSK